MVLFISGTPSKLTVRLTVCRFSTSSPVWTKTKKRVKMCYHTFTCILLTYDKILNLVRIAAFTSAGNSKG